MDAVLSNRKEKATWKLVVEYLHSNWGKAFLVPLLILTWWLSVREQFEVELPISTATGVILLLVAAVVSYTDIREFRIPNWVTYSAIGWGILLNALASSSLGQAHVEALGTVGITQSLAGLFCLFLLMFMIFSVTGGGAGDVKLAAAMGSLLGLGRGIDAITYAMALAGIAMLLVSIVRYGPLSMLDSAVRPIACRLLPVWIDAPRAEHYQRMKSSVPLGPFFAAGIVITLLDAGPDVQALMLY